MRRAARVIYSSGSGRWAGSLSAPGPLVNATEKVQILRLSNGVGKGRAAEAGAAFVGYLPGQTPPHGEESGADDQAKL